MSIRKPLLPAWLADVRITRGFWGTRVLTNRRITIPAEYGLCRRTGRIDAFRLRWRKGMRHEPHIFWDSDLAKWIEAAAFTLAVSPDKALQRRVDRVVSLIASAQQRDGYLNTHFTVVEPGKRWTNLRDSHELYCAGHLMEAGVALFEASGKRALLDVMCRYADHISRTFGRRKGQKRGYCGHPEVELALMGLHRATGERRYLKLAKYFVDERGRQPSYFGLEAAARGEQAAPPAWTGGHDYYQAHAPVRRQKDAAGHAVRALYLYSGMADVAAATADRALVAACRRLYDSVTKRRMYVTGGIGSTEHGERFTFDYDLPNESAYAETCAAIALVFFCQRMLNLERDGRYADTMERALYNGVMSGVSLDGRRFFYANRLAVHPDALPRTGHTAAFRQEWFDCACCPPNLARLLASLGSYVYSARDDAVFVNLFAQSTFDAGPLRLAQQTRYPWDGRVRIRVTTDSAVRHTIALRLPGWCRRPSLALNHRRVDLRRVGRNGYACLARTWTSGDIIDLDLPMPVERIEAHPSVRHNAGRICLQRGPLVYCLEQVDNGKDLNDIALPARARFSARFDRRLLGGCVVLEGAGVRRDTAAWRTSLYRSQPSKTRVVPVKAVPYCLWGNRREGEMVVWVRSCWK